MARCQRDDWCHGQQRFWRVGVNWDVEIMQVDMGFGGLSEANVIAAYDYPTRCACCSTKAKGLAEPVSRPMHH